MNIAVHVTHETVQKIGGIGSVITNLFTSTEYNKFFKKSLLYGVLFSNMGSPTSRLGRDGSVLYSGMDNFGTEDFGFLFKPIEEKYNIKIVYGKRCIVNEADASIENESDVLLVYVNEMNIDEINKFKFLLWEKFKIESDKTNDWDYEQYLRIGVPFNEIMNSLYKDNFLYIFAHEYMGICSASASMLDIEENKIKDHSKRIFYAHEVSPIRSIIEHSPSQDILFYNTMNYDVEKKRHLDDSFSTDGYRKELMKVSSNFDYVFTVSDLGKSEYMYLNKDAHKEKVFTVYNGISVKKISYEEKEKNRNILREYCTSLFDFNPDILFSHVTRLVVSKGLWRDFILLERLDSMFEQHRLKGFFILLSSLLGTGRSHSDVYRMEREYHWPKEHREGYPDLLGYEIEIENLTRKFNENSRAIKAVFINQFGFTRHHTGSKMPVEAEWLTLRIGSDVEFGMSTYEPFGISQIETIPYGGLSVLSSSCGCASLIKNKFSSFQESFHVIDFTAINSSGMINEFTLDQIKKMTKEQRLMHEMSIIDSHKSEIFNKILEMTSKEKYAHRLEKAQKLSSEISWDTIVKEIFIKCFS